MSTRIRLARHGAKKRPFYRIVVTDSRHPRDGRFIEQIGTYDPLRSPEQVEIQETRFSDWIQKGAVPTDTVATLLKRRPAPAAAVEGVSTA